MIERPPACKAVQAPEACKTSYKGSDTATLRKGLVGGLKRFLGLSRTFTEGDKRVDSQTKGGILQ